jgi:hypothetical protein
MKESRIIIRLLPSRSVIIPSLNHSHFGFRIIGEC